MIIDFKRIPQEVQFAYQDKESVKNILYSAARGNNGSFAINYDVSDKSGRELTKKKQMLRLEYLYQL